MAHKVLISDPLPAEARKILEESPEIEVINKHEDYDDVLPEIHGWIVRSGTQVTADAMARATSLKAVCRAGAGVDNVDLAAARERGVVVMNTPGANARAAAELTVALMFTLARNVAAAHHDMRGGGWDRKTFAGVELQGKTLGVLGLGRVGRHVIRMAQGLGMKTIGFDPVMSPAEAEDLRVELKTVEEILPESDFLALHTPLNDSTRGLLDDERFALCKKGIFIVNCSRGGVVDEEALLRALDSGQVAGAALDVYSQEPLPADSALRSHPGLVLTPHLGASSREAQLGVATMSADQLRRFLETGEAVNTVT